MTPSPSAGGERGRPGPMKEAPPRPHSAGGGAAPPPSPPPPFPPSRWEGAGPGSEGAGPGSEGAGPRPRRLLPQGRPWRRRGATKRRLRALRLLRLLLARGALWAGPKRGGRGSRKAPPPPRGNRRLLAPPPPRDGFRPLPPHQEQEMGEGSLPLPPLPQAVPPLPHPESAGGGEGGEGPLLNGLGGGGGGAGLPGCPSPLRAPPPPPAQAPILISNVTGGGGAEPGPRPLLAGQGHAPSSSSSATPPPSRAPPPPQPSPPLREEHVTCVQSILDEFLQAYGSLIPVSADEVVEKLEDIFQQEFSTPQRRGSVQQLLQSYRRLPGNEGLGAAAAAVVPAAPRERAAPRVPRQLQTPRAHHGRPADALRPQLAQRPGHEHVRGPRHGRRARQGAFLQLLLLRQTAHARLRGRAALDQERGHFRQGAAADPHPPGGALVAGGRGRGPQDHHLLRLPAHPEPPLPQAHLPLPAGRGRQEGAAGLPRGLEGSLQNERRPAEQRQRLRRLRAAVLQVPGAGAPVQLHAAGHAPPAPPDVQGALPLPARPLTQKIQIFTPDTKKYLKIKKTPKKSEIPARK